MKDRHKSSKLIAGARCFALLAVTLMIMAVIPAPEAGAEEGESFPVGSFYAKDFAGEFGDVLTIEPTAPEESSPQLLGTKDGGQYVDFKITYSYHGLLDRDKTHFLFAFFVHERLENGSWIDAEQGQIFVQEDVLRIPNMGTFYGGLGAGTVELLYEIPYNQERKVDYKIEFSAHMGNGEGDYLFVEGVGYAYTDPGISGGP